MKMLYFIIHTLGAVALRLVSSDYWIVTLAFQKSRRLSIDPLKSTSVSEIAFVLKGGHCWFPVQLNYFTCYTVPISVVYLESSALTYCMFELRESLKPKVFIQSVSRPVFFSNARLSTRFQVGGWQLIAGRHYICQLYLMFCGERFKLLKCFQWDKLPRVWAMVLSDNKSISALHLLCQTVFWPKIMNKKATEAKDFCLS